MVVVKRVGVWSFARIETLLMAFMGLIFGLVVALLKLSGSAEVMMSGVPELELGYAAILILPFMYGFMGFIAGVIGAAVYNLFASWVGGVELEFGGEVSSKVVKKRRK
ncbi:hypothetical protein JW826_03490 [Candidatus Woesearchaeota archaeon]|nr:hypothetical protein [Candidatus Woesearchaeota archaeon]